MGRRLRVWVTRSQPGAAATAERLVHVGHEALVAPLLEVVQLRQRLLPRPPAAALAFTSASAVRAWTAAGGGGCGTVFAVGDATAAAAREAGFSRVLSARGDVETLAALIATNPPDGPLLHPCAMERAGDLVGALAGAGVEVSALPIYRTDGVAALPSVVEAALAGDAVDAVLLHSPKAAGVLAGLLGSRPPTDLSRAIIFGLSAACVAPLEGLPFADVQTANAPNEAALLERLG